MSPRYDPKTASYLSFAAAKRAFAQGGDTPRAFLERCVEQIEHREPTIKAFVHLDIDGARKQADASTVRWRRGEPLSAVDGLPVGIALVGPPHTDRRVLACARWLLSAMTPPPTPVR